MVTVFDRWVWVRNRFAPELSLSDFAATAGSKDTIHSLYRRWKATTEKAALPGRYATWAKYAARYGVDPKWLAHGINTPGPGLHVSDSELEGLHRELEKKSASGTFHAPGAIRKEDIPPPPKSGIEIDEEVRYDAAVLVQARTKPDGRPFTREEIWVGFKNLRAKLSDADRAEPHAIAAAVAATITGQTTQVPPKTIPSRPRS